ncbi:phosphate ABC transporter substrate-binding protein PstS [Ideonella sp.]|uniref:phosphate ABC transporter substrate-binding protein PstS n=1 Tax=Ideonella sp. TaxID=1929293 RepID=UPI003BB755F5
MLLSTRRQFLALTSCLSAPMAWALPHDKPTLVQGAGATFPAKVYARWAQEFAKAQGIELDYKPTGSGDGIKQAIARTVQLAGTDAPLGDKALAEHRLVQIPMLVGGVVPVINLSGAAGRSLRLDGPVLADIFAGVVTQWNDSRIAQLNPGVSLPERKIVRVVRSDKSGTTEGFTAYLSKVSPAFAKAVGTHGLPSWPGEAERAKGNDGVAATVKATPGAIGYVSHDRMVSDKLSPVTLRNNDGQWVSSSEAGFRSAILQSDVYRKGEDTASLMDMPGRDSWPITLTSYLLIDAAPAQADDVQAAMRFVYWCFMHGDTLTQGTGFAPMPLSVQARMSGRLRAVKPRDGRAPIYLVL